MCTCESGDTDAREASVTVLASGVVGAVVSDTVVGEDIALGAFPTCQTELVKIDIVQPEQRHRATRKKTSCNQNRDIVLPEHRLRATRTEISYNRNIDFVQPEHSHRATRK